MATPADTERAQDDDRTIAAFMARLASAPVQASPSLPTAEVLWLKAELLRRWDAERRSAAPLEMSEPVQIVAAIAAAAVLVLWTLPSLLHAVMP
jgi:hypothetical protein